MRGAVAAALLLACAAPTVADAAPVAYGNDVYRVNPTGSAGFRAVTGPSHSAGGFVNLSGTGTNVVYDYTDAATWPVSSAYLGQTTLTTVDPQTSGLTGRGFAQTWPASTGQNTSPLTFSRVTRTEGTTEADSLVKTTLAVTNTSNQPHVVGVQTTVPNLVDQDDSPIFTPWRGDDTTASVHTPSPAYKQFDLRNDSAAPARDGFPTIRSTWSVVRPDLGATAPDVMDQEDSVLDADTEFAPANTTGTDLSTRRADSVWIWGPTAGSARSIAPGATVAFTIVLVGELPDAAPVNIALPTIDGTPAVGSPLGSSVGTWTITTPFTQYERQWLRCDAAGESCVPIPGATGETYTPTAADAGRVVRLDVTADRGPTVRSAVTVPLPAAAAAVAPATPATPPAPPNAVPAVRKPAKDGKATVLFPSSSARLTTTAKRVLRKLAAGRVSAKRISCVGYTASATGASGYRTTLGMRRAKAVCEYLAKRVDATKVAPSTKAGANPVASNATRKGRARNRRVVATIDVA